MKIRDRIKELRRVRASELMPNPLNWRTHPEAQANAMRGILAEIGIADAVLARETKDGLVLIDGHLRAEVAPDALLPVLVLDVSEKEAAKILATHDTITTMATIDQEMLAKVMADADIVNADIESMLAEFLADLEDMDDTEEADAEDDDFTPPSDVESISTNIQLGDLIELGAHRVVCGDATNKDIVEFLMAGKFADMVLTDPPYGVSYIGKTSDALTIQNDDLTEEQLSRLITSAFDCAEVISRPGAYWYATVPAGPLFLIFASDWKRRGILRQMMVWAKDSMVLGHSEYHYQHEPILFGWVNGPRHRNEDRTRTTLWSYARPKASREHPTMKPIELWGQAIRDGSHAGEVVYDPFLGSGTSVIASEQLGRQCFGLELNPRYCQVIVNRYRSYCTTQGVTPNVLVNGQVIE